MNLNNLYELQKIDSQLASIQSELDKIEVSIKQDEAVKKSDKNLQKIQKNLEVAQKELRMTVDDIDQKKIKLSQSDTMLYSGKIQNPKELQDLQQEIQSLKNIISKMEDKQLDQMIHLEEVQQQCEQAQRTLHDTSSKFETTKSQLSAQKKSLCSTAEHLHKKRAVVLQSIDNNLINRYEALRKKKNGVAIALLENDACSACGSQLTPSERQDIRSAAKLFQCPTCGRILYKE